MMNNISIFYPIFVHMVLVLALYILLVTRRLSAVKHENIDPKKRALDNQAWSPKVVQVSNNIANQFETPMLFYSLCFISYLTESTNTLTYILAWSYVFMRYVHAYIHVGSNYIPYRLKSFAVSLLLILALLLQIVFSLII